MERQEDPYTIKEEAAGTAKTKVINNEVSAVENLLKVIIYQ